MQYLKMCKENNNKTLMKTCFVLAMSHYGASSLTCGIPSVRVDISYELEEAIVAASQSGKGYTASTRGKCS